MQMGRQGGFLVLIAVGIVAAQERPMVHYPKPNGVVFALPHVSLILEAPFPHHRTVYVDGKPVPEDAISGCRICAGSRPAVLAAKTRWTVKDGAHQLEVLSPEGGRLTAFRYTVDTTTPSLNGITGTLAFPDAQGAFVPSLRVGGIFASRTPKGQVWLALTGGRSFPLEVAMKRALNSRKSEVIWKGTWRLSPHWSLSVGQHDGDAFFAFGYHTQPNYLSLTLGGGKDKFPSVWLGISYSLSHLTAQLRPPTKAQDFFAVLDLIRLQVEVDSNGRVNFGGVLCHPYGWRIGISHLQTQRAWIGQVSLSLVWR